MTEFTIPAPDLARLTHNALAFMPARSAVKVCRVWASYPTISITATDLFAVGHDWAEVADLPRGELASIDLSREDLQSLDKAARAAKKEDVRIVIRHEDGMHAYTEDGDYYFLDASAKRQPEDLWKRCDELLTRLERVEPSIPEFLTLDPKLLSAFGKVKTSDGKECIADLYIAGPSDQILVKIGPTFRGAFMPVNREANARYNSEGQWELSA